MMNGYVKCDKKRKKIRWMWEIYVSKYYCCQINPACLIFFPTNLSILIIRASLREHIAYIDMASLEILGIRDELRK